MGSLWEAEPFLEPEFDFKRINRIVFYFLINLHIGPGNEYFYCDMNYSNNFRWRCVHEFAFRKPADYKYKRKPHPGKGKKCIFGEIKHQNGS